MKIGIATFHFVKNYGAVLQCFALTRYLRKQGHDVTVIDYRPRYHTIRFAAHKPLVPYAKWRWFYHNEKPLGKRIAAVCRDVKNARKANKEQSDAAMLRKVEDFRTAHFPLTRPYATYAELQNDPPETDAYIAGSDQLWNPDLLDRKLDPVYFLAFGSPSALRISYAVSLGRDLVGSELDDLRRYCRDLSAVSIREKSDTAAEATGRSVHVCIDPTLLLDAEDYAEAEAAPTQSEPYIFVYSFHTSDAILAAVEAAKKRYGCKVVNGSPKTLHLGDDAETVYDYGPAEFLTYLKNAACVVTNSFHGTAFSVIYRKDFITVAHPKRPQRMAELLKKLDLSYRLWGNESFSFDRPIDYDAVQKNLALQREIATEYLSLALRGVKSEDIPHHAEELC